MTKIMWNNIIRDWKSDQYTQPKRTSTAQNHHKKHDQNNATNNPIAKTFIDRKSHHISHLCPFVFLHKVHRLLPVLSHFSTPLHNMFFTKKSCVNQHFIATNLKHIAYTKFILLSLFAIILLSFEITYWLFILISYNKIINISLFSFTWKYFVLFLSNIWYNLLINKI